MPRSSAVSAKPQDAAIADVSRGAATAVMTEDQKRAAGVDASADAGPHDYSPEAQPFQAASQGSSLDTYAGSPGATHTNVVGETTPLVVGQAPTAPAHPMRGSVGTGQTVDPNIPNAIHQSPVVRGLDIDPKNDPAHPDFASANKDHPDYGKPSQDHKGQRTVAPTYEDLKAKAASEQPAAEEASAS